MSDSISLDIDALAQLYVPLEPVNYQTGWNSADSSNDNASAAYFVSQGSDYYFDKPTSVCTTQIPSADLVESIENFVAMIVDAAGTSPSYQSTIRDLQQWVTNINNGEEVTTLTVSGFATNITLNDQATLTYVYALCPTLNGATGVALLMQHTCSIDWSGTLQSSVGGTLAFGKNVGTYASIVKTCVEGAEIAGEAIPGLDVIATIGLACSLTLVVAKHLDTNDAADSRLNFVAVLAHALIRTSSCVSPGMGAAYQSPCIQAASLTPAWQIQEFINGPYATDYQNGAYFGTYDQSSYFFSPYDKSFPTEYNQPYIVYMPEQSWMRGGAITFATVLTYSNSKAIGLANDKEEVYVLSALVYSAGGNSVNAVAQCTSGTATEGDPDPATPVATGWYSSSDKSVINGGFAEAVFDAVFGCNVGTQPTLQLKFVIPPLLLSMVQSMKIVSGAGVQPYANLSITWSANGKVDDGNAPAVAVKQDGTVIAVYDDNSTNINTHLHWAYGNLNTNGAQVEWNNANQNPKYEEGSWPALAINPGPYTAGLDNDVLELHDYSSSLWWEAAPIDESKKSVDFGDRTEMNDGHNAGLFIAPNGLGTVLFANGSDLQYNTGYFDANGDFSPYQSNWTPVPYLSNISGGYPTVITTGSYVLEVHNDSGNLWFNIGTISSDNTKITWGNGPFPFMMEGSHPHLACFDQGRVVLTYDNDNRLYAALGQIVNGTVQWFITNLYICGGQYPAICGAPNFPLNFVMCFNDTSGHIYAQTGVANFPG